LTSFIMSNMDNQEDVLQKVLSSDEYSRIFYNEKERKQKERKNEKRKEKRQILSESQKETDIEKRRCDYAGMPNENHTELLKSMKEYQETNKESFVTAKKGYRKANKDEITVTMKGYWDANKDETTATMKGYRDANKDAIAAVKKGYREAKKDETEIANKEYYTSNKGSILDKRKIPYATELHQFLLKHGLERHCVDVSDEEEDNSILCMTCYSESESVSNDDSVFTDSCYSNSCCSLNANCFGEQCSYNESGSINDFGTNYSDDGSLDNNSYENVNSLDDVDVSDVDDDAINRIAGKSVHAHAFAHERLQSPVSYKGIDMLSRTILKTMYRTISN